MVNQEQPMQWSEMDIYGQVHPVETPELIEQKLVEFEEQVKTIPPKKKISLSMAEEKCPQLLTNGFKLQFLRCEVFRAKDAAKRYAAYWDKKREICGEEKAFLAPTLDEALKDDRLGLEQGFCRLVGTKDPSGRNILFVDPSREDASRVDDKAQARAAAYTLQAALEDENTQQKGVVALVWPAKARFTQFNHAFIKLMLSSIKGALPVRLSGVHICQPPAFFRIVWPIIKVLIGERLRKRVRLYFGSYEEIQAELAPYGLTKDVLPSELGGNVVIDHEAWLEERRSKGL